MSIMMCLIPLWLYSSMLPKPFALWLDNLYSMFWLVRPYDDGRIQVGDKFPRPRTLDKYWGYFCNKSKINQLSMQGNTSTICFSDNQGVTHHLLCSKGGQQGDGLETIRFPVTVHPSIGRVCERHLNCKVVGICDNTFIIVRLSKTLSCAAEMKKILKADLDMDLNVPKFNVFFPDTPFSLDTVQSVLKRSVRADPALADLAAMGAGVLTDGMRVAGVLVGVDAWVKTFVAKKARLIITDVPKLDVVSAGLLHNQVFHFCQNARMVFLGRNTPTPLLSEFMTQVDDTIVEAVCRHGTGGGHVDWSPHLRKFVNMKIQVPRFRGGFGITPNEGSAISAFYSATCALVVWLGSHGDNRPAQDFADVWAPGLNLTSPNSWYSPWLNLTSPNSWYAPLLQALSTSHVLLLQDYGCVE